MSNKNQPSLSEIVPSLVGYSARTFSEQVSLGLLNFLSKVMHPHEQSYDIVQIMQFVCKYLQQRTGQGTIDGTKGHSEITQRDIMDGLKKVCVYYGQTTLSYSELNEYSFNQQLVLLAGDHHDEEYMGTGDTRVRIDENIKLCVMPMQKEQNKASSRITEIVFRQNLDMGESEQVYVLTRDYAREISIRPELIGSSRSSHQANGPGDGWYHFKDRTLKPKRNTLEATFEEKPKIWKSSQLKELQKAETTNSIAGLPSHFLSILKINVSDNLMGFISLDLSFSVEPLDEPGPRLQQGYIGNILRDSPAQISNGEEILLFNNYSDRQWIIINKEYLYLYCIPKPDENVFVDDQNNYSVSYSTGQGKQRKKNRLLTLCQKLPSGCIAAVLLTKPFVALLMDKCIVIVKLIIQDTTVPKKGSNEPLPNCFKVTNTIYNDAKYRSICFHEKFQYLFVSDFGAYLMRVKLNHRYGDIEEQGVVGTIENEKETHRSRPNGNGKGNQLYSPSQTERSSHYLSIYAKQSKSPSTIVIRNNSRQILSLMTVSRHYSTMVTLQAESYEKSGQIDPQGEVSREWGNINKIKLWDIHHLTVYQSFVISVDTAWMSLQSNGLYLVTDDRGYLGYYPFNQSLLISTEGKRLNFEKEGSSTVTELSDEISLQQNILYFHTFASRFNKFNNSKEKYTKIFQMALKHSPQITLLKRIPTEVTSVCVGNKIYVLQNSTLGNSSCQLHSYNKLGLKQDLLSYRNREDIDVLTGKNKNETYNQEYKNMKRLQHHQYDLLLWNNESLKLLDSTQQNLLTLVWNSHNVEAAHSARTVSRQSQGKTYSFESIKSIDVTNKALMIVTEFTIRVNTFLPSSVSQVQHSTSKSKDQANSGIHQQTRRSVLIMSTDTDRISYRLNNVSPTCRPLSMYTTLLVYKEEYVLNPDYETIKVLDLSIPGDAREKLLYCCKYRKSFEENKRDSPLDTNQQQGLSDNPSEAKSGRKNIAVRKNVLIEECQITITQSNQLLLLMLFKVEITHTDMRSGRLIKSDSSMFICCRNITCQLLDRTYQIARIKINKTLRKNVYEYQAPTEVKENSLGQKTLSIQSLLSMSNYVQSDLSLLDQEVPPIDLSPQLTKQSDKPECMSVKMIPLKKDESLELILKHNSNLIPVLLNFHGRILEYNHDTRMGTISVVNKLILTITLYTFQIALNKSFSKAYEVTTELQISKIACIRVTEDIISPKKLSAQQCAEGTVEILAWNQAYKQQVDELWEETFAKLKHFISADKELEENTRRTQVNATLGKSQEKEDLRQIELRKSNSIRQESSKQKISKKSIVVSLPKLSVCPTGSDQPVHTGENLSKMFKKWCIWQAIGVAEGQEQQLKATELRTVDRFINKVLKVEGEKEERIKQLVESIQQMKHLSRNNYPRERLQETEGELANIYEGCSIVKKASIKNYIMQKNLVTRANPISQQTSRLTRNDTYSRESPIRDTQLKDILIKSPKSSISNSFGGVEGRLSSRLQTIMDKGVKDNQMEEQRTTKILDKNRRSKLESRQGIARSQPHGIVRSELSHYSDLRNTTNNPRLRMTDQEALPQYEYSPMHKMKTSTSLVKLKAQTEQTKVMNSAIKHQNPETEKLVRTRCKTQVTSDSCQSATQQLQGSMTMLKQIMLPQIRRNKDKQLQKMKQKKSFVKELQSHLLDHSLDAQEERRKILLRLSKQK